MSSFSSNKHLQNDDRGNRITTSPITGDIQTIRSAVSANDSANPTVGTGKSFVGYRYVELEITLGGTTPTWTVTPLLLNSTGTVYMEGESIVLTGAKTFVYLLQINGSKGINFRVDNSSGTSPMITIKGRGVN